MPAKRRRNIHSHAANPAKSAASKAGAKSSIAQPNAQLWGGRFEHGADPLFKLFNDSLPFDHRLTQQDIAGSIGWAKAITAAGVLTLPECEKLINALEQLSDQVTRDPGMPLRSGQEDVHSFVESWLVEKLGPLGKKLHTGRSRNDQVATDIRLWTRAQVDARIGEILALQRALVTLAQREHATIIPGYTHVQRAQPILAAHWCMAYFEMLSRDAARLADARTRINICPLGSAALAGTTYPIDRETLAEDLGFDAASDNSLDATSDRDFALETLAAASICAVHLSRLAEDLVFYASQEFALVEMHDSVSSGSSLMPQKKNPDAAELIRGKSGRIIGDLVGLLVTLKGLPLAYNKDLQEDKEGLFDAMDHLSISLRIATRVIETLKFRPENAKRAAQGGYSNATDLADYLVSKGVPFRDAHEEVGKLVRHALAAGKPLEDLTLDEFRLHTKVVGKDVYKWLTLEAGLAKREVRGGTGPKTVARAVAAAAANLGIKTVQVRRH
ncbi:MAG: argininosuccinate lyase [Planctomycetes bacterium]|nr:argininosuccinate lyase [Planctomycetota bacterium]